MFSRKKQDGTDFIGLIQNHKVMLHLGVNDIIGMGDDVTKWAHNFSDDERTSTSETKCVLNFWPGAPNDPQWV